jgi:hypothetical protein
MNSPHISMGEQFAVRDNAIRYYLGNLGFSIVPISPGSKAPIGKGWNQPGGYYEPKHIETALGVSSKTTQSTTLA